MIKKINNKFLIFLIALSFGIVVGFMITVRLNITPRTDAANSHSTPDSKDQSSEKNLEYSFIKVAELVGPAVASISSERTQKVSTRRYYFNTPQGQNNLNEDFFNKFFSDFFGELPQSEQKEMGLGSGVIISKDGYILTNEHVVDGADKITVTLSDGRKFSALLKGSDERSDLAVIKIEAKDLPYAELGNSDYVRTGQWVIAIGNPFGFMMSTPEPTVTTGVVSALHRALPVQAGKERGYFDLIQTDAAINPGNSGGPLCDLEGKIVGINVAIYSTTGGYQGIGFAIPINTAKYIIDDLSKGKQIKYGWLGVTVQPLDQDLADFFGISMNDGVLVSSVIPDGPAAKAGLKSGDVIVSVNSEKISGTTDILQKVGYAKVGEKITLEIIRDKKSMEVVATVAERPIISEDTGFVARETLPSEAVFRGMKVVNITPELQAKFSLKDTLGVIIKEIQPNSPALDAGLKVGDVIKEINKIFIKNTDDFQKVVKNSKGNVLIRTLNNYAIIKEPAKK